MKKIVLALLAISGIAALTLFYVCDNAPTVTPSEASTKASATEKIKADRPTPVFTAAVARDDMPVWIEALGRVTPRQQVVLRSRIDGELQKLHFNEG